MRKQSIFRFVRKFAEKRRRAKFKQLLELTKTDDHYFYILRDFYDSNPGIEWRLR